MPQRICKRHIGRPLDIKGDEEFPIINGRIVKVSRGIATIEYCLSGLGTLPFTTYLSVNDPRIIEVY